MTKVNLTKKIKNIGIIVLALVGIFLFFNQKSRLTVMVRKVEVKDREVKRTVSASGTVKSRNEAELSFLVSGIIANFNVSEGDTVKKGQLISYLNPATQVQNVQSYKDARDTRLRQRELFVNEKRDNMELLGGEDSYNIKLKEYNEALSQAEASYQSQISILSNYYMYAPFDGVVVDIIKDQGSTAIAGYTVCKIANLDEGGLVLEVSLDQEDFGYVKEGQDVDIELDAYENETFKGTVEKLPLSADEVTGSFIIKIGIKESEKSVNIGMTGDAYMITDKTDKEVQSLTFNEIFYDADDKPYVWILDGGKVKKLNVEIGLEGDLYTEVKTDLKDKVIAVPAKEDLNIEEGFFAKVIN